MTLDASLSAPSSRPVRPPRLRPARFADYPQMHGMESRFFPDSLSDADRSGLFQDNPLWPGLAATWPVGWVLEDDDGRIVGSLNNIPSSYRIDGEEKLCANGHCWAVLTEYRGYATMLMDEYFAQEQPDLFLSAKVGVDATPVWSLYAHRVPAGDWEKAAYAITRYHGFARTALQIKHVPLATVAAPPLALALRLKDALTTRSLPDGPPSVEFDEADGFDTRFDVFWRELVAQNPGRLLGVRDSATLRWHYGVPMRANRVWIVTATRGNLLCAYCVLKLHLRPSGVRSMKLVDFQTVEPDVDLLAGLLTVALRRSAAEDCFVLEHHGCGLAKMRRFDELAPYRATKPRWSFYYCATAPEFEARLADPDVWDPSEYDGDSSYK
jgi:hypothetical protein